MIWYLELSKNKTYFSHICSYNCNVLFIVRCAYKFQKVLFSNFY